MAHARRETGRARLRFRTRVPPSDQSGQIDGQNGQDMLQTRLCQPPVARIAQVEGLHAHGELELARAAAAADIPFTMATGSMTAMETVAEKAGGAESLAMGVGQSGETIHEDRRADRIGKA